MAQAGAATRVGAAKRVGGAARAAGRQHASHGIDARPLARFRPSARMAVGGYAATAMSRPGIAAALSALIPGLGQARLGDRRRGALIALPFVGLIVIVAAALLLDPRKALETILSPGVLVGILVLIVVLGAYHLAAVLDAFRLGNRLGALQDPPITRRRALGSPLLLVALAGVIGIYGVIEFVGVRGYQAAQAIFVSPTSGLEIPAASFAPRPTQTPGVVPTGPLTEPPAPTPTPVPVPAWAADGRLNLLLVGTDAGPPFASRELTAGGGSSISVSRLVKIPMSACSV